MDDRPHPFDRHKFVAWIEELKATTGMPEFRIAKILGLQQQYMVGLKDGSATPSFATYAMMTEMAGVGFLAWVKDRYI